MSLYDQTSPMVRGTVAQLLGFYDRNDIDCEGPVFAGFRVNMTAISDLPLGFTIKDVLVAYINYLNGHLQNE